MFFMNAKALAELDSAKGFEVGVGPSLVMVDEGMAKTTTTSTLKDDIYAFVFGQKGLIGYGLVRAVQRLAGDGEESAWKPALVEIEDALVPGFIIEELEDGRLTVFVPSVPTPLAGAVYILDRARVHPLDVPFTQAIGTVSKWGSGSRDLVAAMRPIPAAGHAAAA